MIAKSKCAIAVVLLLASLTAHAELPPDVSSDIQREYASGDDAAPTRYVEALADLNGDGENEVLVHVVGPAACGSGGCPTLIYTLLGSGYWRMATIGLTNLPIRASATRTRGWRNLIVTVGGGGAEAGEVELAFDGRGYPKNPTVRGRYVTASTGGGDIVIAARASFDTAAVLPTAATDVPAKRGADSPSFACAEARLPAEKTVCASRELAAMDRKLNEAYSDAMRTWAADEQTRQRAAQKQWLSQRNACSKAEDAPLCLRDAYRRRQIELQILSGKLTAPTQKGYLCKGLEGVPFTAAFYPTDPPAAVLTRGDRQVIAVATPSGDGTRYVAKGVEFWEEEGGARVEWDKSEFDCVAK
ncbi:MliC family protein [Tahibacter sp.]|uniref:MliC family protein n=1 Tax=Tahibacter sp. TaxID=2056211 RepID=UPI0028C4BFF3|nr:MliC family protein [Tahibacter sp.]